MVSFNSFFQQKSILSFGELCLGLEQHTLRCHWDKSIVSPTNQKFTFFLTQNLRKHETYRSGDDKSRIWGKAYLTLTLTLTTSISTVRIVHLRVIGVEGMTLVCWSNRDWYLKLKRPIYLIKYDLPNLVVTLQERFRNTPQYQEIELDEIIPTWFA
jgi:hypothetical protein